MVASARKRKCFSHFKKLFLGPNSFRSERFSRNCNGKIDVLNFQILQKRGGKMVKNC